MQQIEQNRRKERLKQEQSIVTLQEINAQERKQRITKDTEALPGKLNVQFENIRDLKKDIKRFMTETEALSTKFIQDMEE